ncbi:putative replication protein A 70 kDa DNA-binding subunit C-like [Capsicum annuum]|nr:putative replication protein A 70 kDa DNA-binding subunit C-like [Capsicum annuum]
MVFFMPLKTGVLYGTTNVESTEDSYYVERYTERDLVEHSIDKINDLSPLLEERSREFQFGNGVLRKQEGSFMRRVKRNMGRRNSWRGTMQCSANYVPLSPISFLERSAVVYGNRLSIVHGDVKFTWRETCDRCLRLASALTQLGISRGGVVAALAPNIPAIHSEAKIILVDHQLLDIAKGALEILSKASARLPHLILISYKESYPEPEWNSLSPDEQDKIQARQRVNHIGLEEVDVKYPESMKSVLFDVKTNGRLVSKGDLSVKRLDGYMELKDRSKDIIISGGENISTSEVESVIFSHPAVLEAAVVGRPDDHWGNFLAIMETIFALLDALSRDLARANAGLEKIYSNVVTMSERLDLMESRRNFRAFTPKTLLPMTNPPRLPHNATSQKLQIPLRTENKIDHFPRKLIKSNKEDLEANFLLSKLHNRSSTIPNRASQPKLPFPKIDTSKKRNIVERNMRYMESTMMLL